MPSPDDDPGFDPSVTAHLKKDDPVWYHIRETVTLKVLVAMVFFLLVTAVTAVVQFSHLRSDFSDMKDALKGDQERAAADAALHQHMEDIDDRVSKLEELRDYQKGVAGEPRKQRSR